jgi:hypothetical protein
MRSRHAERALTWTTIVLLTGACVVHVKTGQEPPPPAPQPVAGPAPAPHPVQAPVAAHTMPPPPTHAAPPAPAQPAPAQPAPPPPPQARRLIHFSGRIVHPPPAQNAGVGSLDIHGLKLKIRPNRTCGPRESTPGHWIHIDCNQYTAVASARPFSQRKLRFMLGGGAKLDAPISLADTSDHRADGTEGPMKDQGQVGSCTSFSLSTAMDNAIRRQNKPDTTSSLHIWSHYGYPDMHTAGDDNLNKPIATWELWPYDERVACEIDQSGDGDCGPYAPPVVPGAAGRDPQVQAKIKDLDARGHWKVTAYDELDTNPDTLAQYLSTGADVWCSMNIGSTWLRVNGDTIADWTPAQVEGGHAVVLSGYRHQNGQRQFLVHNSWGTDWGDKGYAWVSEKSVIQFIKRAYKVTVTDTSAPPPPPPAVTPVSTTPATPPPADDPNALTDDDCAENQLVDAVSGQCAEMCPDDSRPANGQCGGTASARKPVVPAQPPPKVLIRH